VQKELAPRESKGANLRAYPSEIHQDNATASAQTKKGLPTHRLRRQWGDSGGGRVEILRSSSFKLSIGIDNGAYDLEQLDMHQHYLVGTIGLAMLNIFLY
jgi:hypothetical protein